MTIHETYVQPAMFPFRTPVEPCPLDCAGVRAPYGGQTRMRLTISSGLANGLVVIDPTAQDLIAVHCSDGPQPRLQVLAGEITLSWRTSFGDWLRGAFQPGNRDVVIVLHPSVEWTLAVRGGIAHVDLDLAAGTLAGVDIRGGCSDVVVNLPAPTSAVPVRIAGGVSKFLLQRPAATGVALATAGGMASLRLDDQRFDAIGGSARLETRNLSADCPRYDLQINGGAADLAIAPA